MPQPKASPRQEMNPAPPGAGRARQGAAQPVPARVDGRPSCTGRRVPATSRRTLRRRQIDTLYIDWGGLRCRVDIDPDSNATPAGFDCYDAEDIAAFRAGRWQYVDLTVTVECPGIDVTDQLGAVEFGTMPNTTIDIEWLLDE